MKLLDTIPIREKLLAEIKDELKSCSLDFLLYLDENDSSSIAYIKSIERTLGYFSIPFSHLGYSEKASIEENVEIFAKELKDRMVVLARPLPFEERFLRLIDSDRDPDMLTYVNQGKLFSSSLNHLPATAMAVKEIADFYSIEVKGKRALILGRSISVGLPCFQLLQRNGATATLAHSKTQQNQLKELVREADIIVLATGKCGLIEEEDLKEGVVLFDCGYNANCGDLGFTPDERKEGFYTKVPGGIGRLNSLMLLKNAIYLKKASI